MHKPARPVDPAAVRVRVGVGAVVVLIVVALVVGVIASGFAQHGSQQLAIRASPTAVIAPKVTTEIYVHIVGAVTRPGLYHLHDGARAIDAVSAAGGFTEDADQTQLNLARFVSDGEQIVVPAIGDAVTSAPGTTGGKVNLNTADESTLETLPRVGPAMAARIIAWRTANGRFSAIEDLMSVTGVGPKTFDGLKDLITV